VTRAGLLALAAALVAAYVALGAAVSGGPPGAIDRAGLALVGQGVPPALALTRIGHFPVYAVLCMLLLAFGLVRREWLGRVVLSIAVLVAAWQTSDLFKFAFHRPRMEGWIAIHETSYSYASGHATLALAFYGLWTAYVLQSELPRATRITVAAALVLLILGIGWSRLALGAHYVTDVVGGYLLGGAFLCVGLAIARIGTSASRAA
jgi:membrane-associated phospholipid phosphatase